MGLDRCDTTNNNRHAWLLPKPPFIFFIRPKTLSTCDYPPHIFFQFICELYICLLKKKMYVLRFKTSTDPLIFFLFCFMFMHWLSEFIMLFHLKYMNYLPRIGVIFVDKDGEEKHVKVSKLVEATWWNTLKNDGVFWTCWKFKGLFETTFSIKHLCS